MKKQYFVFIFLVLMILILVGIWILMNKIEGFNVNNICEYNHFILNNDFLYFNIN